MKSKRQQLILEIIEKQPIQTQEELAKALLQYGIAVTQATISRDIRELNLVKTVDVQMGTHYTVALTGDRDFSERQMRIFRDTVLSVQNNELLVVLHTISGSANAAAETVDGFHWPEILGCVAGDNTILIAARSAEDCKILTEKLRRLMR